MSRFAGSCSALESERDDMNIEEVNAAAQRARAAIYELSIDDVYDPQGVKSSRSAQAEYEQDIDTLIEWCLETPFGVLKPLEWEDITDEDGLIALAISKTIFGGYQIGRGCCLFRGHMFARCDSIAQGKPLCADHYQVEMAKEFSKIGEVGAAEL